jgi:hypothetical protein
MNLKSLFFTVGIIWLSYSGIHTQVNLVTKSTITEKGLYFEGENGIDYHFGKRITPHGDCIDIANGYIYISWYRGGMDDRHVMLSRKKIGEGEWATIEFPQKHIGYRGDTTKGDSHNTIALGICTIDNTVHLLYDMHAYSAASFPDNFFNYSVSEKGGAIVPDEQWNIDLFRPKRNYLRSGENYERTTYPNFFRNNEGAIFAEWRLGGSGNGNQSYALYDGIEWQSTTRFNVGKQATDQETYSIYGSFDYIQDKFRIGFSIRYKDFPTDAYELNSGLYYAYSNDQNALNDWYNSVGEKLEFPVQSPEPLKIGSPLDLGVGKRISSGPSWTVTESEAIHFITTVNNQPIHYFKDAKETEFKVDMAGPKGSLFAYNDQIYSVGLTSSGYPQILSTPEGKSDWKIEYQTNSGTRYRHGNIRLVGDKIFYYLMERGNGTAQPLHLLEFEITNTTVNTVKKDIGQMTLYPNPVNENLHLPEKAQGSKYIIYNTKGESVKSGSVINSKLDVSDLIAGLYFIKIDIGNKNFINKFVKK